MIKLAKFLKKHNLQCRIHYVPEIKAMMFAFSDYEHSHGANIYVIQDLIESDKNGLNIEHYIIKKACEEFGISYKEEEEAC